MSSGTPFLEPTRQFLDNTGAILAGGKLYFWAAGSSTPQNTYSDPGLTTPNANPVILDSSARATIYLSASVYKVELQTSAGASIWVKDNIAALAPFNQGTFTGAITFLPDSVLTVLSNTVTPDGLHQVHSLDTTGGARDLQNIATTNVSPGFLLILYGANVGANPVTVKNAIDNIQLSGGDYVLNNTNKYITLILRGTTWYELARGGSSTPLDNAVCDGRLTLTSGTPFTAADVLAATSVYWTPRHGNRVALYDGVSAWNIRTFSELSIPLGADAANLPYDVFIYDNSGTAAIERLAWTNDAARATALVLQDGVLVKSGATTRRFVASYRTTGTVGQTEDSRAKRYVSNAYHRGRRSLRVSEATASWVYTIATIRQVNGAAANQVEALVCLAGEIQLELTALAVAANSVGAVAHVTGIGEDSTTVFSPQAVGGGFQTGVAIQAAASARLSYLPAIGRHFWAWLEYSTASGVTTWYSTTASAVGQGLSGSIDG